MGSYNFEGFSYNNPGMDGVFTPKVYFATAAAFKEFVTLNQFVRVPTKIAGNAAVLINKATRDYWKVEAGPEGSVVIHRLTDETDPSVSF